MKNFLILSSALIFAALFSTACSDKDNPLGPEETGDVEDPVVIETPKYMQIREIILTRFPANKSNGDKWDYHVFANSPTRRPDIYVELGKSGSNTPVYRSDIKEDAILETAYDTFSFTRPASENDGSLPYQVSLDETYAIDIWDDDGLTVDDVMGRVYINAGGYYNDDNATFVFKTLTSGGITIKIEGKWIY